MLGGIRGDTPATAHLIPEVVYFVINCNLFIENLEKKYAKLKEFPGPFVELEIL